MELNFCNPVKTMGATSGLLVTFPNYFRYRLRPNFIIKCGALTKQSHRFLSALARTAVAGDESATNRLIRKLVAGSTKSVTLNALSDLLSPVPTHPHLPSSLALTLYSRITEASWFIWNPKLVAELVAVLDKHGQYIDSEVLISETVSKIGSRERELVRFYGQLIESHSKQSSCRGFNNAYSYLSELFQNSSSVYVKRSAYESMVSGLCAMDRPHEAENLVEEMRRKGAQPAAFELKSIIHAYGRLGLFSDMKRSLEQMEDDGFTVDTVCSNMVLSSLGAYNELAEMVWWLQKIKKLCIPFSIRTYNSVLNSCPAIMSMIQERSNFPLSIEELRNALNGDEALLVDELIESAILEEVMVWDAKEVKLDLHGLHLGAAYLIMLQWMEKMREMFDDEKFVTQEVLVVCGSGNHSNVRGEAPVKGLIKEMMVQMRSPMRINRKNNGCFVAKGKVVQNWLCCQDRL